MPKLKTYYPHKIFARFDEDEWREILAYKDTKGIATIAGTIRKLVREGLDRDRRRKAAKN